MITAQHRKSSHQILQVSSKCPHTDNCTITAVKYLTAVPYISIPEKKKKEKKKKLQQTGKLCFSPHLISHGHYPDFFFTSLCHSFGSQQNIYTFEWRAVCPILNISQLCSCFESVPSSPPFHPSLKAVWLWMNDTRNEGSNFTTAVESKNCV